MIGKTISHYRILEKLGEGGMGVVYKAEDLRLHRPVALKFLPPHVSDGEAAQRFMNEAYAVSALDHPNICAIHEIDQTSDGRMFIVMPCYEGESLQEIVKRGPMDSRRAVEIACQVAKGLAKAHEKGIIHRDIKPGNILVTSDGLSKIVDFGLAKLATQTGLTRAGTTLGTVMYMSPEQARGEAADERSDIWSLGVVLYEMITGRPPFRGEYESAVLYSILNESPEPITALRSGVPLELERITNKCLTKDPAERYQTTADFSADLRRLKREISEQTLRPGPANAAAPSAKTRVWRIAVAAIGIAVVLVVLLAVFNIGGVRDRFAAGRRPGDTARIESLAILPFANAGEDPDTDYLSDEIPASITGSLSRLSNLRVVPRATAFRYRGREADLAAVGRKLNVRAILTGQIRVRGEELSIRAELVDVANDRQLWGDKYSLKLADILTLEQNIATEITDALRLRLTDADRDRLAKSQTENAEAHRLYLKGLYFWNKRSEAGIRSAIAHFQQAIEKDPAYALAYAGLADSYNVLAAFGFLAPNEAFPKAQAAVSKALEFDSTLAEAHTSLAFILHHYEWNWLEAEIEYKRAIGLDPAYATALHWYRGLLLTMGRDTEGIAAIESAARFDPLSLPITASLGSAYLVLGQYEKAEAQCLKAIEMDSSFAMARSILAIVYMQKGMYDKAINELKTITDLATSTPQDFPYLGYGYARGGRLEDARRILAELNARARNRYVPPCFFAIIHIGLGEKDEAFKWLDKAYEERDYYLTDFPFRAPICDPISDDPRFGDLMRRMGLNPPPRATSAIK